MKKQLIMIRSYFADLTIEKKTELTWNYGELVKTVESEDYYLTLFLSDNFYVEILIDKFNNQLCDINVQDDVLYVKDVSLKELMSKF